MEKRGPIQDEYLELALQYGFVVIFAMALPLGSLLAYLNNIIEIHTDAFKMVCVERRNFSQTAKDIGCFAPIFNMITVIGIVSNCAIMVFVNDYSGPEGASSSVGTGEIELQHWTTVLNLSWFPTLCLFFAVEHFLFLLSTCGRGLIPTRSSYTIDSARRAKMRQQGVDKQNVTEIKTRSEIKAANYYRRDRSMNEVVVDKMEDFEVHRWRAMKEEGDTTVDEVFTLTRANDAKRDYHDGLFVYDKDSDWMRRPQAALDEYD